ncbi:hypothetical protein MKY51_02050 [Solibacillus sp. FSL R5-0691]|uniref:hypothetical protein n=1 Tax=Solibacillus sp. FSL R5-0691 TaxID=2921653 RepID=UPI0030D1F226
MEGILEETWVILEVPPVSAELKARLRLNTLNLNCDQNLLEQLDRILEEVREILADRKRIFEQSDDLLEQLPIILENRNFIRTNKNILELFPTY